jgi:hypothetical protein
MVNFIESLLDPHTWMRVAMVVVGAILIYMSMIRSDPVIQLANAMKHAGRV